MYYNNRFLQNTLQHNNKLKIGFDAVSEMHKISLRLISITQDVRKACPQQHRKRKRKKKSAWQWMLPYWQYTIKKNAETKPASTAWLYSCTCSLYVTVWKQWKTTKVWTASSGGTWSLESMMACSEALETRVGSGPSSPLILSGSRRPSDEANVSTSCSTSSSLPGSFSKRWSWKTSKGYWIYSVWPSFICLYFPHP